MLKGSATTRAENVLRSLVWLWRNQDHLTHLSNSHKRTGNLSFRQWVMRAVLLDDFFNGKFQANWWYQNQVAHVRWGCWVSHIQRDVNQLDHIKNVLVYGTRPHNMKIFVLHVTYNKSFFCRTSESKEIEWEIT